MVKKMRKTKSVMWFKDGKRAALRDMRSMGANESGALRISRHYHLPAPVPLIIVGVVEWFYLSPAHPDGGEGPDMHRVLTRCVRVFFTVGALCVSLRLPSFGGRMESGAALRRFKGVLSRALDGDHPPI